MTDAATILQMLEDQVDGPDSPAAASVSEFGEAGVAKQSKFILRLPNLPEEIVSDHLKLISADLVSTTQGQRAMLRNRVAAAKHVLMVMAVLDCYRLGDMSTADRNGKALRSYHRLCDAFQTQYPRADVR